MKNYKVLILIGEQKTVQELKAVFTDRRNELQALVRSVAATGKAVLTVGDTQFNFECLQDISALVEQLAEVIRAELVCAH